jgi:hypothetical protein
MNALISGIFPLMAASSSAYPFVVFAIMMVVQFLVVLFGYPETKGLTLEEMQKRVVATGSKRRERVFKLLCGQFI